MDEYGSSGNLQSEPVFADEYEDWSDIDTSNLVEEGEDVPNVDADDAGEADQPETEEETAAEGEEKPEGEDGAGKAEEQKESDQTFELKHLDETRTVNREEVIALAQKGMDYDRIRGKLDELRGVETVASENQSYAEFIKELADNAGITVEQLIDSTRARILTDRAAKEGRALSQTEALEQAKQTREARAQAMQQGKEAQEARNRQEKFREEAARFRTLHPDVKADEIPPEVWKDYDESGNLADAWNKHVNRQLTAENESLRKELETLKQEAKNAARSTGSLKTAGASQKSAIESAWEEALKNEY